MKPNECFQILTVLFEKIEKHFSRKERYSTANLSDKKVFGIGLKPTLRTNTLEIEEDYQLIGSDVSTTIHPMVYKKNYYIDGGISEILFQYSSKRNTNFSLGIQYSFLFGNQLFEEKRETYDIEIDSVSSGGSDLIEFIHEDDTFYVQGLSS